MAPTQRRGPARDPQRALRLAAGIGLAIGLGGVLLLGATGHRETALRYAIGFGAAFVLTWMLETWKRRR